VVRAAGEQVVRGDRPGQDLLVDGVPDELVDHGPIRRDAVGERVRAGDLHDPRVHAVRRARVGDESFGKVGDVAFLRVRVGGEQVRGEVRVFREQLVADDEDMVDGVEAAVAQRSVACLSGPGCCPGCVSLR
jgi:hypothetical protein